MRAFHNSREIAYREPFGAVNLGGAVSLAIDIFDTNDAVVTCRLWSDGKGETLIPMRRFKKDGFLRFSCTITPDEPQLLWYSFIIEHDGKISRYGAKQGRTGGEGAVYDWEPPSFQLTVFRERKAPDWYKNGIVYQIFPDRFCRGDDWRELCEAALKNKKNGPDRVICEEWDAVPHYKKDEQGRITCWDFYGGTLSGIAKKLPYLKELGVSAIYLNPIFAASSNHRYDTGDYLKLDAMLGNEGDFEKFAKEAEKFGISIILDGVFNHTGCDSKYFNKYGNYDSVGAIQSEKSPYRSWFNIKENGEYESWWGVDDLPSLNERDPDYQNFIFGKDGVVRRWLKAGAKGWRLDVADELPDDFIAEIKKAVIETKGDDGLLLGEVWEDASNKISYGELRKYFLGSELDSVMNYPLCDAMIEFFTEKLSADEMAERITSLYENYPREAFYSALNLIGSHDRPRILTLLGDAPEEKSLTPEQRRDYRLNEYQRDMAKKRLWLMVLCQMTMPGVPCIYYGDEMGLEGYADPYNRAAFPWGGGDEDISAIFRNAMSLRRLYPLFTNGDFKPISFGNDVFGFERKLDGKTAVVLVNRNRYEQREVSFKAHGKDCSELIGGQTVIIENGEGRITLPPFGSAVIYFSNISMAKPLKRGSGVLCHITSLYNNGKAADIGEPAKKFIDFLSEAGQKYWQILPLNPTDQYGSPYAGLSAFAWNISLIEGGEAALRESFKKFKPTKEFEKFCVDNAHWLDAYSAFMALKEKFDNAPWQDWPKTYKKFGKTVLNNKFVLERAPFYKYCQFEFLRRWKSLRSYAKKNGVMLIGDMPIYISEDSADVWANQKLFNLDENGRKTDEAGVPPDYFAKDGQLWGNPTYNWDAMKKEGYTWWFGRLAQAFEMFDYVRLDHFRGFEAYWSVPFGKKASAGRWIPGPGTEFFAAANKKFGKLPIIAEDLGIITPGVRALIAGCGFNGMDVLQFSDSDPVFGYTAPKDKIVYTGTHDNQTLLGWCAEKYGEANADNNAKQLIKSAMQSSADVVIMPLQDVLGLGDEARMNTPGVAGGNWKWQLTNDDFGDAAERLSNLVKMTERS